jgi:hypothetical protein
MMRVEGGTPDGEVWAGEVRLLRAKRTAKNEMKEKISNRKNLFG